MKNLPIMTPVIAVLVAIAFMVAGATWWVALIAFFSTAPILIGTATLLCSTILPCDSVSKKQSGS